MTLQLKPLTMQVKFKTVYLIFEYIKKSALKRIMPISFFFRINNTNTSKTTFVGITQKFTSICFFCGDFELNDDHPTVLEMKKKFSIVRPICNACITAGNRPACRNALKVGVKRK